MRLSYHDLARERFAERFAKSQSSSPPQAQAGRSRSCDVPNTRGLGAGDDMGSALAPVSDPWLLEIHSVLRTLLREVQRKYKPRVLSRVARSFPLVSMPTDSRYSSTRLLMRMRALWVCCGLRRRCDACALGRSW